MDLLLFRKLVVYRLTADKNSIAVISAVANEDYTEVQMQAI